MITAARPIQRVILYEGRGSTPLDSAQRGELLRGLLTRGYTVSCVQPGSSLANLGHRQLVVLGLFDGAAPELSAAEADDVQLRVHDIVSLSAAQVVELVDTETEATGGGRAAGWKPWFPVIDYDRCTNCMQCLSFCLFDVYGVKAGGEITVQNESNCKTDCPACSRVCPEVAILFPKYKAGPINGDVVSQADVQREAMKVDISALLGGDIYSLLRERSAKAKSRFSAERDDERALKERQRCLNKMQQAIPDLDIPAEVMSSLPSLDQIRLKAEQAKKRAAEALQANEAKNS